MRTLRLFERVTILIMAMLLVTTLVGCFRYEMERVSGIEAGAPHSGTCRSHIVKGGDHSSLYCPDG
jgi:hypothetical protein